MVNLREITSGDARRWKLTIDEFKTEIKRLIPNYKSKKLDQVLQEYEHVQIALEDAREEALTVVEPKAAIVNFEQIRESPFSTYRFRQVRQSQGSTGLRMIYLAPLRGENTLQAPLPSKSELAQDPLLSIPDSEDIQNIVQIIRSKFRPILGDANDVAKFKKNLFNMIREHASAQTTTYIMNHLDVRVSEVLNDANYGAYYVMRNGYMDLGDYVIQKYCQEAAKFQNPVRNCEFSCFYRCCIEQAPRVFGPRAQYRLGQLDSSSSKGVPVLDASDTIAREFKIKIVILDIELNTIHQFNYADKCMNRTVVLVAKDNHVYSLRNEFKKSLTKSGCHLLIEYGLRQTSIDPIPIDNRPVICGELVVKYNDDDDDDTSFDDDFRIPPIMLDAIIPPDAVQPEESITAVNETHLRSVRYFVRQTPSSKPREITEFAPNTDYIFFVERYGKYHNLLSHLYLDFYRKENIAGNLFEKSSSSDQKDDVSDAQLIIHKPNGTRLYFRNRLISELDSKYPAKDTFSLGSVAKYLFLSRQEQSYPKVIDPLLYKAFKGLCRPFKNVVCGTFEGGRIYYLDLKKAYYQCSDNLWIPNTTITWEEGMGPQENVALYMVLESPRLDITNLPSDEELVGNATGVWKMTIGASERYIATVTIQRYTNAFREFGDWLMTTERPQDYKKFFNSLIGRLHPTNLTQASTIVFHNEIDFAQFLAMREGKQFLEPSIDPETNLWKMKFVYDSSFHSGFVLPYIPAQIIQKCNRKVMELRKHLQDVMGCKLIMTMTDSCIFQAPRVLSDKFLKEQIQNGWDVKVSNGDKIHVHRAGCYRIWKNNKIVGGTSNYDQYIIPTTGDQPTTTTVGSDAIDTVSVEKILTLTNPNTHELVIGAAGDGKSSWIRREYWDHLSGSALLVGTTGVSASSINARTIHAAFGMIVGRGLSAINCVKTMHEEVIRKLQKIHTVVIDEVFMAREDVMEVVDQVLRLVNNTSAVFGGKKLVMVGDSRQLGAVKGTPFVGSSLYNRLHVEERIIPYTPGGGTCRMLPEYKFWTDYFRTVRTVPEIRHALSAIKSKTRSTRNERGLTCFFYNREVEEWNELHRQKSKDDPDHVIMDDEPLILRKNIDVKKSLYNGRIGKARTIDGDLYFVYTTKDVVPDTVDEYGNTVSRTVETERLHNLKNLEFKNTYFLAYAITIHKSQGLTLDDGINLGIFKLLDRPSRYKNVETQLSDDALTRLVYVGISRVRDFDKLYVF